MTKGGNNGKGKHWRGGGADRGGRIIGGIREFGGKTTAHRSTPSVDAVVWLADCVRNRFSNSVSVTAPNQTKLWIFKKEKCWILSDEINRYSSFIDIPDGTDCTVGSVGLDALET